MNPTELNSSSQSEIESAESAAPKAALNWAMLGAGALAAGILSKPARAVSPQLRFADIPGSGDIKVLNYALALEDLEAEFYVQALQRLTGGGRDAAPDVNLPGLGLSESQRDVKFMREFGRVEREHRDFLRAAIRAAGGPVINPFKYTFSLQNKTRQQVLQLTYTLEQGGTSAYLGAIPFFATKTYVPVAGGIQGTEARHNAIFADILNDLFGAALKPSPPPGVLPGGRERPVPPDPTLAQVSPFIVIP